MRVATSVCMSEMPSASITRRGNRVRVKYKALTYLLTRPTLHRETAWLGVGLRAD